MQGDAGRQQQHGIDDDHRPPADADAAPLLSSSSSPAPHRASLGLETPRDDAEEDLATARRCLYASHFLSAWGARAWEFAAGLALFFPAGGGGRGGKPDIVSGNENASLSLVAALGLAQQAAQALSGPYLGREIDRLPRLKAAERAYALQAAGTLASALFVFEARRRAEVSSSSSFSSSSPSSSSSSSSSPSSSSPSSSPVIVYLLGSLAALFAALAAVGASGATLSVEKEWTQALARGGREASSGSRSRSSGRSDRSEQEEHETEAPAAAAISNPSSPPSSSSASSSSSSSSSSVLLASINATMRRIDLACLLAAPGVAGLLLSRLGTEAAVALIALYGCCAWLPQASLLRRAVRAAPSRLREREGEKEGARGEGRAATAEVERQQRREAATAPSSPSPSPSPLASYLSADAFSSAFSLALLYLTVLSFGPLATAYLNWRGLNEVELAFWRGVGAAAGIAATAAFPWIRSRWGSDAAGVLGIGSQFCCLLVGWLVAFVPWGGKREIGSESESKSSGGGGGGGTGGGGGGARFLAASLALSRFGLWLFDLFASQNLQERVPAGQLGAVNGVQSALQAALGAASFAAGGLVGRPGSFWVLALGSLGAVLLALLVCVSGQLRLREKGRREERERAARREIAAVA